MKGGSNWKKEVCAICFDGESDLVSNYEIIGKRSVGEKNPTCRPCFSFNVPVPTTAGRQDKM